MRRFRSVVVSLVAVLIGSLIAGFAAGPAAAETATSFMKISPRGPLYKDAFQPVDVRLEVEVIPDPGSTTVSELANTRLNLPKDFTFSTRGTPPCEKDIGQNDPQKANRPTAQVVAECPDSVVGGGTAVINVGGSTSGPATIRDPILTVFNGGDDGEGNPVLLIHGFSQSVLPGGHGVPMKGALKDGVLDVSVPPLPIGSAVTAFTFDLPGAVGKDPNYSQAKCSTGTWRANAVITLHDRDSGTGTYGNEQDLVTADTVQACDGKDGKAKFAPLKVKGPKSVKAGKRGVYTVAVKNTGDAPATGVKVTAGGKGATGKGSAKSIAGGATKKIKVKVKFARQGTVKLKFKASGLGVKAKTKVLRVKVG